MKNWIYSAFDLGCFYDHKVARINEAPEISCAEVKYSKASQEEFYDFLLQHLLTHPGLGYSQERGELVHEEENLRWPLNQKNLWQASLWLAEDICLLENIENSYVLTAASVCSPSNWFLEEKIGQSVDFIHAPVPNYQEELSERVNRFLQALPQGKIMLRYNWSIQANNALCWRDETEVTLNPLEDRNSDLYWRIERQTFMRLPKTGAIVFGIRIFLHSFAKLREMPNFNKPLERLLHQLPDSEKRYKSLR